MAIVAIILNSSRSNKDRLLLNFILFIYFWLHWVFVAAWAFSSCGEWGLLFVVVHRHLIAVASRGGAWALDMWASVVVEHGLRSCSSQALEHRLSSCGTWA